MDDNLPSSFFSSSVAALLHIIQSLLVFIRATCGNNSYYVYIVQCGPFGDNNKQNDIIFWRWAAYRVPTYFMVSSVWLEINNVWIT